MIEILKFNSVKKEEIFARVAEKVDVSGVVSEIIDNVRKNGDAAVKGYCEKFDGAKLDSLEVTKDEIAEAVALVEPRFLEILSTAAQNIESFHKNQKRDGFEIEGPDIFTSALLGRAHSACPLRRMRLGCDSRKRASLDPSRR